MTTNKQPHIDIRNIRTTNLIMESFIEELRKKAFKKITVNDICERANISRGTFYRHFEDKYDLMRHLANKMALEIKKNSRQGSFESEISTTLDYIERYEDVIKNLFWGKIDVETQDMLYSIYSSIIKEDLAHMSSQRRVPDEIMADFWAAGMLYLEMMWVNGKLKYTKQELAMYLCHIARSTGMAG